MIPNITIAKSVSIWMLPFRVLLLRNDISYVSYHPLYHINFLLSNKVYYDKMIKDYREVRTHVILSVLRNESKRR